jgi:hypothetical protein
MKKIVSVLITAALFLLMTPISNAAPSLQSTYLSKLTAALKVSWAQKYMGSDGFALGNKTFLKNPAAITEQVRRIKLACGAFDSATKLKKSTITAANEAALGLFGVEAPIIDLLIEDGKDEKFIFDYEFVQTSALTTGVSVYCKKHLARTKSNLVPKFNSYLEIYLEKSMSSSVLDEPAANLFVNGSALVTLTQVWRISLNGVNGPKTLREVTDEIYDYLTQALGSYPTERDLVIGFQPGNSMHSIFSRLVYDQEVYDAIRERLIYIANN